MFHIRAQANAATLRIIDIGFAPRAIEEIAPRGRFLERADLQHLIRVRPVNSHKGMYGHPLVIAGGRGKSGAVLLASRAALQSGRGPGYRGGAGIDTADRRGRAGRADDGADSGSRRPL